MSGYILILVWLAIMAVIGQIPEVYRREQVGLQRQWRMRPAFAALVFAPVIIWAGMRDSFVDTAAYIRSYQELPDTLQGLMDYLPSVEKDVGFTVFSGVIKLLFGESYHPYFMIIALIQGGVVISVFRKYSDNYLISIFLFLATSEYLSWMFNGIRQFLAVVIILAGIQWIVEKKYVPLICLILLASTIHMTALLMIPIIFIVQGKPWNGKTMLVILASVATLFFTDQFTTLLDKILEETQYEGTLSYWLEEGDDGVNPIRVLVYSVPAIMAFFGRKYIASANDPVTNVCVNMSIMSVALYLVGMVTSGISIGRLPIYANLYSYILLPGLIDKMFTKRSAKFVRGCLVVLYLMYYYYQMHFVFGRI